MNNFPLSKEADYVIYIRVIRQPQNIVVGEAGFLLRSQVLCQIGNDIAGGLDGAGGPREAGSGSGVDAGSMVYKVRGESRVGPDLLIGEIAG